jgi:RND family efflux transporter MFP subunit
MKPRVLFAALALAACHRHAAEEEAEHEPPAVVHCEALRAGVFHETRVLRGSLQLPPERLAHVSAQVPGRVLRLAVREGDVVTARQLLAEIEASPLVDQSTVARGELETARLEVSAADATVTRLAGLVTRGVASQQELDDARVRAAQARASLAQRSGAVSQVRRELGRTRLLAPMAGVVMRVIRGAGELVDGTPATPVLEVGDPSAVSFAANAVADDLIALRAAQAATITVGSFEAEPWEAHVDRVAIALDPATGVGTAWLHLDAPHPSPLGVTGVARVVVADRADALTVPESALRERDGDHAEVVLCVEHKAKAREVRVGATNDGRVIVLEGLSAGDQVVTDHPVGLEDDAELREPS